MLRGARRTGDQPFIDHASSGLGGEPPRAPADPRMLLFDQDLLEALEVLQRGPSAQRLGVHATFAVCLCRLVLQARSVAAGVATGAGNRPPPTNVGTW